MDLGIRGRTALVLGSSQGLGRAAAQALAREGVSVILTGRSPERLAAAAGILRADGAEDVTTELVDLSDSALLAGWVERMGARGIDILVTNGGGPPPGRSRQSMRIHGGASSTSW
jgi:3-oxoacyl-[acyl-carrier protein] reductase